MSFGFVPPRNIYDPGTPEWLYDEIMRHIEPDLMIEQVPLLDTKYAGESPEQRQDREAAYAQAFQHFDTMLQTMREALGDDTLTVEAIRLMQRQSVLQERAAAEADDRTQADAVFDHVAA